MAQVLEPTELINRLALGLQILDAISQRQVIYPVYAEVENGLPHQPVAGKQNTPYFQHRGKLPVALSRHASGRYSLIYQPGLQEHIDVRFYDLKRQYVPRRLRFPLLTLQTVLDVETNETPDYLHGRSRQPVLYPGAYYDLISRATGLRGRVLRDGNPMPWVWVEAYTTVDDTLVGRARGDERGEFLLLLNPIAAGAGQLATSYDIRVRIFGPQNIAVPVSDDLPHLDPLWNLPLEQVPVAANPDGVSPGMTLPADYVEGATAVVPCQTGRMLTGNDTADFVFNVA